VVDSPSNTLTVNINSFSGSVAAYTCRAVTQSNQCVSAPSNTITIIKCSGGGNQCPTAVTLTALGNCPSFSLQATISNPQPNTIYTFTLRRSTGGSFSTVNIQVVGPFATVPSGGISATFSGLPAGSANFVVDVNVPNCPVISSNAVNLPNCGCQNVGARLSSDQPGNPSSLTICTTPPGPSTIVLTCAATSSVSGATFRFVQNGVTVQESASNTLTLSISQFTSISLANIFCQVITQSGQCVGTQSNVITVQRCSGGGNNCPTNVRLVSQGGCPFTLLAVVGNPQPGVTYTFTLRRSTSASGPFTAIAVQTVGPFTTVPSGGISASFSGLPSGNAFFIVDVSVANCPTISSNVVNLPNCGCQNVGATLSSNQAGNPSSLTICTTPPGPSTIVLTCAATSSVSGATFRFVQNGVTVQESASNTLTLSISQFTSISLANIFCQVITQSGQCVGTQSNVITVQRCSGGNPCTIPGTPSLSVVSGNLCPQQTAQLQCVPAECSSSDTACLGQFKYQLFRSSGFFVPGPTSSDFQFSNTFFVTALAGESFTCRVMRADTSCTGNTTSASSSALFTSTCTV